MHRAIDPWPRTPEELERLQETLAEQAGAAGLWHPEGRIRMVAGVFVALGTGDPNREVVAGDPAWASAVITDGHRSLASSVVRGQVGGPYQPGYMALQIGPLLEEAVRALQIRPAILLVNATGRDHPRGAGLALHLGAVLGLPTVGVTDRPLVATGAEPERKRGSSMPVLLRDEVVGYRVRTKRTVHPVVAHAAWRTDAETARDLVLMTAERSRTPDPLRRARHLARLQRALDEGRLR